MYKIIFKVHWHGMKLKINLYTLHENTHQNVLEDGPSNLKFAIAYILKMGLQTQNLQLFSMGSQLKSK